MPEGEELDGHRAHDERGSGDEHWARVGVALPPHPVHTVILNAAA